ncbi:CaiB/BaiF CoA transferase family protein [Sphingomonas astaxanthinifaciens]|uniref:CoA transferase n=1 Tax=Sphingomonas astaxanthinifaciens DSM 22298 TaxID=1123267 RepID=A0ABQ5Z946_9SPHN|nr:CaiB/BaiF CoA-transferase family protein [Sphingomonas astaxanthinifaciens]GLR48001.1 CoA transferase [Sphingomonas astaxanthinifaciens DSM 22298]
MPGALSGVTIVEMAGLGPGPFAAMMLADHGARVIRVERPGNLSVPNDPLTRNRESIALDLRQEEGRAIVARLAVGADGLIEGYRPGVMERLGLGPEQLRETNPRLVYGRVTGWGQAGPLAQAAGHDINYLALTGLLSTIGEAGRPPVPPLNLVADYAGGGLCLAFGMVAALLHAQKTGEGQVIDAAMTDGAALTGAIVFGLRAAGLWRDERGANLLDGGDPIYGCYACADGKALSVGALEPQFRAAFYAGLGVPAGAGKAEIAAVLATRPRDEWVALFEGTDACVAPVLSLGEAPGHPHHEARGTFVDVGGVIQPGPAPRLEKTPADPPRPPRAEGEDGEGILAALGYDPDAIAALRAKGVLR